MKTIDYAEVTRHLLKNCLRVNKNDVIKIDGGAHALPIIEEFALEILKAGAHVVTEVYTDNFKVRKILEIDEIFLSETGKHEYAFLDEFDGFISILRDNDPLIFRDVPEKKFQAYKCARLKIAKEKFRRNKKHITLCFPTPKQAEFHNVPYERYHDMFWNAVMTDPLQLYEIGRKIRNKLQNKENIHITSENGSDLHLSVKNRRIIVEDGMICNEDIRNKDFYMNVPFGEVFTAPVEKSVNGLAVFDSAEHNGKEIKNLRINFKDGKINNFSADCGEEVFRNVLENATGHKDIVAELGFGMNPAVTEFTGDVGLDEKIAGSIHIAIGENRIFGGNNSSSLHWDLIMLRPTVKTDDSIIINNGVQVD